MRPKSVIFRRCILVLLVALFVFPLLPTSVFAKSDSKKVYELNFSHHMGMTTPMHLRVFEPFKEDVEKFSNGRIKLTLYPGGALAGPKAGYDMLKKGAVDFIMFVPAYSPGVFPLCDIVSLPFAMPSAEVATKTIAELHRQKLLDKELYTGKAKAWLATTSGYQLFLGKKKVTSLEELSGLKLRIPGGLLRESMITLGATPVSVPGGEFTTAMERGVIDGGIVAFGSGWGYKLQDSCKYVVRTNVGTIILGIMANKAAYDKLPHDLQLAIDRAGERFMMNQALGAFDHKDLEALEFFKSVNLELIELDPAEKERWVKKCAPIYDKWIEKMKKRGLPIEQVYAEFKRILAGYGVTLPR